MELIGSNQVETSRNSISSPFCSVSDFNQRPVFHQPVMVQEVIQFLAPSKGIILDATVGGGGHAEAIISLLANGFLIGIDLDPEAIAYCQSRLNRFSNFRLFNCNFIEMEQVLNQVRMLPSLSNLKLEGVLFDLGVSLHQIQTPKRGFSYELNGPLDMRFNPDSSHNAFDLIRGSSLFELERILNDFGEEKFSRRIAKAIYEKRKTLNTTKALADLIQSQLRKKPPMVKRKALQRTFQALRIATNEELTNLQKGLKIALRLLAPQGRIVVLAYHSLEDRIVKNTFRELAKQGKLAIVTKKPIRPTEAELIENPASDSARLRSAIKIS